MSSKIDLLLALSKILGLPSINIDGLIIGRVSLELKTSEIFLIILLLKS